MLPSSWSRPRTARVRQKATRKLQMRKMVSVFSSITLGLILVEIQL
jgi:hypothetical protein